MRTGIAVLALAAAAAAAPFTAAFDGIRTELVDRRDDDLAGDLDRAQRRQLRAVLAALARLDRPADDLADDVRTAATVYRTLERAFPAEFAPPVITDPPPDLSDAVDDSLADLLAATGAAYDGLAASVPSMPEGRLKARAEKARLAARAALDLVPGTGPASRAARPLGKAHRFVARGLALVARSAGE